MPWTEHEGSWFTCRGVGGVERLWGSATPEWYGYPVRTIPEPGGNMLGPCATPEQAQAWLEVLVALDELEERLWTPTPASSGHLRSVLGECVTRADSL